MIDFLQKALHTHYIIKNNSSIIFFLLLPFVCKGNVWFIHAMYQTNLPFSSAILFLVLCVSILIGWKQSFLLTVKRLSVKYKCKMAECSRTIAWTTWKHTFALHIKNVWKSVTDLILEGRNYRHMLVLAKGSHNWPRCLVKWEWWRVRVVKWICKWCVVSGDTTICMHH